MKKKIGIALLTFILLYVLYLCRSGYKSVKHKQELALEIQIMPDLELNYVKHIICSPPAEYKIIYFFSPQCEHCKYMTHSIVQNPTFFSNSEIRMITFEKGQVLEHFITDYNLTSIPFISIGIDSSYQFPRVFGSSIIPSIYIYRRDTLVAKFLGEVKIESLVEKLK